MAEVTVIGGGLAGCEAAWQLAEAGFSVRLLEMKPVQEPDLRQWRLWFLSQNS